MKDQSSRSGHVHLIGAGPGAADLLTIRAAHLIAGAEVVVFDRLVSAEILALVPSTARLIDVGKLPGYHKVPQDDINALLVRLAQSGAEVVRLKGGDPFIFGRGSEEAAACRAAGIPVSVVPGITAAQGAAAATGVPLTHRGLATGLRYVTGHRARDLALDLDWQSLADPQTTLVVYMGVATIADIAARLIARGLPADLPVLAVAGATTAAERRVLSTLGGVGQDASCLPPEVPALFIIGRVVTLYPADLDLMLRAQVAPDRVAHA